MHHYRQLIHNIDTTDDDVYEADKPAQRHARRASAAAWPGHDRFPSAVPPVSNDKQERAAGLLRRLSLGGSMTKVSSPLL